MASPRFTTTLHDPPGQMPAKPTMSPQAALARARELATRYPHGNAPTILAFVDALEAMLYAHEIDAITESHEEPTAFSEYSRAAGSFFGARDRIGKARDFIAEAVDCVENAEDKLGHRLRPLALVVAPEERFIQALMADEG